MARSIANYYMLIHHTPPEIEVHGHLFRKLFSAEHILHNVERIAEEVNSHYQKLGVKELIVVCTLKGAVLFFADLVRRINVPSISFEFMKLTSYAGMEKAETQVTYQSDPATFKGKHVLITEDICDTGLTIAFMDNLMRSYEVASVEVAVMVRRPDKTHSVLPRFIGIECSDFIVGYGLDLGQAGRQHSCIYQKVDSPQ